MRANSERRTWGKARIALGVLVLAGASAGGLKLASHESKLDAQVLGAAANKPDTTPPAVSVTFPAHNGVYGPATWGTGSAQGSASDTTGVKTVEVKFGSGLWGLASGTTTWSSPLELPVAEGLYTVSVRATDTVTPASVANTSSPVVVSFRVDRTAPAAPVLTNTPDDPTIETKAQFNYRAESGATFACTLDGTPSTCGPQGLEYKNRAPGTHTFTVWAVDAAGNRSAPTSYSWTIVLDLAFGINGDAMAPVYPGGSSPLNLRISNPYNFSIKVFTVDVTIGSTSTACTVNANFDQPTRRRFTLTTAAVIPGNSSRFLNDLRPDQVTNPPIWPADWPTIAMTNTAINQDSCKGTSFTLSYTGTATKP